MSGRKNVFDATREVGARSAEAPVGRGYPCAARDCPMPGVLFLGGGGGICGWHYGVEAQAWPAVTRTLADWSCVTNQVLAVRRVLVARPTDSKAHAAVLRAGEHELAQQAPDWGLEPEDGEDIGVWVLRLTRFLDDVVAGKAKRMTPAGPPTRIDGLQDVPVARQWAHHLVARAERGGYVGSLPLAMAQSVVDMGRNVPHGTYEPPLMPSVPPSPEQPC